MEKVYQYDNFGFYMGETASYGNMPHNCTDIAPPVATLGEWERYQFTNGAWVAGNDYRGAQGYVDGVSVTVKTPELPEGFSFEAPMVEVEDEPETVPPIEDRITALEDVILTMMLGGANV